KESTDSLTQWLKLDCETKKPFVGDLIAICQTTESDDQNEFPVRVIITFHVSEHLFSAKTTYVAFIKNITSEQKHKELLMKERQLSEALITNILPKSIAALKLQNDQKIIVNSHNEVTVLFADIVGFTPMSANMSPEDLIIFLNGLFSAFDDLVLAYKLEKIKTIGDCYFVASGVPEYRLKHAEYMMEFAIDILEYVEKYNKHSNRN